MLSGLNDVSIRINGSNLGSLHKGLPLQDDVARQTSTNYDYALENMQSNYVTVMDDDAQTRLFRKGHNTNEHLFINNNNSARGMKLVRHVYNVTGFRDRFVHRSFFYRNCGITYTKIDIRYNRQTVN